MTSPGLNRSCIGRCYEGEPVLASAANIAAFALAGNDPNPAYVGGDAVDRRLAPPLFPVRLNREVMAKVLLDPELRCDMLRLVHGEQAFDYERPIYADEWVHLRATIDAIEDKHSGQVLRVSQTLSVDGEVIGLAQSAAFIRGSGPCPPRIQGERAAPFRPPALQTELVDVMEITLDQAQRYAEASLDRNPIHLDPAVARAAGLPGVILQGTCSMAMASRAVIKLLANGDPSRLKKLSVRFSKPVFLPDQLTTAVWATDTPGVYHFESTNQRGEVALSKGVAKLR
jgi:acyl dehydratase